jgi:hypothetical protein
LPLFTHTGLAELDYTPGTIRTEMSDAQYVSLVMLTNLLSALSIGQYGGGGTGVGNTIQQLLHYWTETRLNPRSVVLTDAGGINNSVTVMTTSLADGAVVDIGTILKDRAQTLLVAEQILVTGITVGASTVTLTIQRGFNGTTAASHAQNAVMEIVGSPVPEGSDIGRDMSRSPSVKANTIQTWRRDVIITGSMVSLARHGLVPGQPNMVAFQLHERWWEALQDMERSAIYGIGTPSTTQTDYQEMWGLLAWLGYSSPVPNSTSVLFNANGAFISDLLFNQVGINIYLQGGEIPDAIVAHPVVIDRTSRIFRDQLRLSQTELVRGFNVDTIRLSLGGKPVKLIMSGYMPDPTVVEGVAAFLDLDRLIIVPFLDRFCFLISSPSMKDADMVSLVSQWTTEFRNTGTDSGYTSQVMRNFAV